MVIIWYAIVSSPNIPLEYRCLTSSEQTLLNMDENHTEKKWKRDFRFCQWCEKRSRWCGNRKPWQRTSSSKWKNPCQPATTLPPYAPALRITSQKPTGGTASITQKRRQLHDSFWLCTGLSLPSWETTGVSVKLNYSSSACDVALHALRATTGLSSKFTFSKISQKVNYVIILEQIAIILLYV